MMEHLPKRKPIRLPDYDYAGNGVYFVTICTDRRCCLFWADSPVGATCGRPPEIRLSTLGEIVEREIGRLSIAYPSMSVDHYVIMPNHIHLLLRIIRTDGRPQVAPTVSRAVQQFKGAVTKSCGRAIWQRSFYDHVIRDESDYLSRWKYIDENPLKWTKDPYYEAP